MATTNEHPALSLIDNIEQRILGGKPEEKVTPQHLKLSCKDVDALLAKIETESRSLEKTLLSKSSKCRIFLLTCQLAGRKGDFEKVLVEAEKALNLLEYSSQGPAMGYKGYALFKLSRFDEARVCLERSMQLRLSSKNTIAEIYSKENRVTYAMRQEAREVLTVEKSMEMCCRKLGASAPFPPLVKFPRTAHLFHSGGTAVSVDDLIISGDDSLFLQISDGKTSVIIEEKVDGANVGFSLSGSSDVIVQNRSHYISSGDHSQFGPVTEWIAQHREALFQILSSHGENRVASKGLILYGEWVVARHSIPYRKLPGYFIAFDIYDRLHRRFFSRQRFHRILEGSGIPVVPVIETRTFGPYKTGDATSSTQRKASPFVATLKFLLNTPSQFRSDGGPVEGVVLRVDDGISPDQREAHWLQSRVKIVRPDFVAGCSEGHWMSRAIEKQIIDHSFTESYLSKCYVFAPKEAGSSQSKIEKYVPTAVVYRPESNAVVQYKDGEPYTGIINPRRRVNVTFTDSCEKRKVQLPRNFSWLWINEVAVSSTPKEPDQIAAFSVAFGVTMVITLTEEEPLQGDWFNSVDVDCTNNFVSVENGTPPSVEQMDNICKEVVHQVFNNGNAVVVHCGGGKGRAGTVAACLLMMFGREGIRASHAGDDNCQPKMTSEEAIREIRNLRPGSIETDFQERFVREYSRILWKRAESSTYVVLNISTPKYEKGQLKNDTEPEKENSVASQLKRSKNEVKKQKEEAAALRRARQRVPRVIILMGLPGSGKSTFTNRMVSAWDSTNEKEASTEKGANQSSESWVVINQDRMGRKACLAEAAKCKRKRVILDRCNPTEADRIEWWDALHSPSRLEAALVHFAVDADCCVKRVQQRVSHETIPQGRGERIVRDVARIMEPPTSHELKHMFGTIEVVQTNEDVDNLLVRWGAEEGCGG